MQSSNDQESPDQTSWKCTSTLDELNDICRSVASKRKMGNLNEFPLSSSMLVDVMLNYMVVKIDDPNNTIEVYIRLGEEKARRRGNVNNWETATYGKIWYDEDVHDLRLVETEFPDIVYNDTLRSKVTLSCEPMTGPYSDTFYRFYTAYPGFRIWHIDRL
nr:hypothetical protein [Tanacetum cinerariifolium]